MKNKKIIGVILLIGIGISLVSLTAFIFSLFDKGGIDITTNYSDKAVQKAEELGIKDTLIQSTYSQTLDTFLESEHFDIKYIQDYFGITYINSDTFIEDTTLYLSLGYDYSEINVIPSLSTNNINLIKDNTYTPFLDYADAPNLYIPNVTRYIEYQKTTNLSAQDTVTRVNLNIDLPFYSNITEIENKNDVTVLVNKYNSLGTSFIPSNLVSLTNYSTIKINEEAGTAFTQMIEAATKDGFTFEPTSAYRDGAWQSTLYNNYVATDGVTEADTYSARPGHSEHQTGLAIDIKNPSYYNETGVRLNDEDYQWIKDNAHKYGYIVRYIEDSTDITGYMEEPWHLRYLGIELATSVANSNLTYDEYYDLYIMEY